MRCVVALGGNALLKKQETPSVETQRNNVLSTFRALSGILKDAKCKIAITHGNGPQVGAIMMRSDVAANVAYSVPLSVGVAQSQGEIGHIIELGLRQVLDEMRVRRECCTLVTHVIVDEHDPRLKRPTKPIGRFYTKEEAEELMKKGYHFIEDAGRGYRRVVPSPKPLRIVEAEDIARLFESGHIVVCAGGGGVPVVAGSLGLKPIDAVIDKDFTSMLVAEVVRADTLVIITSIDGVYFGYGTPEQRLISKLSVEEASEALARGEFKEGSMKPKVEACLQLLTIPQEWRQTSNNMCSWKPARSTCRPCGHTYCSMMGNSARIRVE